MNMDEVIRRLKAQGDVGEGLFGEYHHPRPLAAEGLARLRLPTGEDLPPDLTAWLQYDASWLPLLGRSRKEPRLRATLLRSLLVTWAREVPYDEDEDDVRFLISEDGDEAVSDDELVAHWIGILPQRRLADVHAVLLPSGDQQSLLMLEPGRRTLRVLGFHKNIELWWKYKSFAGYLAHYFGFEHPK